MTIINWGANGLLTRTEMPDRCTNAPSPHDNMGNIMVYRGSFECIGRWWTWGVYGQTGRCPDAPNQTDIPTCLTNPYVPASKWSKDTLFRVKFLYLKSWKNERTSRLHQEWIHTGYTYRRLWAGHKKVKWQKHAICENMLIMKHVHCISTEMKDKKSTISLNAHL